MGRRDRRRKSGAGAFFGGTFFGFLLGIGAIVGICAFAYFKVSAQWINDTFDANIDLGNEEINNKTLNDVVKTAMGIGDNVDNYTLNDLKNDFGVELPAEIMGIDIQDLKSVPLAELGEAFQNKLSNLSAKEIESLFSSEALDNIMSKTATYYYYNGALYEDEEHTTEVDFDYTIDNYSVKIKSFDEIAISADDTVEISLNMLPLTVAIDTFAGNLGDNLTLRDLHEDYGVNLPDYIYEGNEDKTVNEIESVINDMYVAEFLGYTINDSDPNNIIVKNGAEEVTGLMYELAVEKIENLKNVQDKFATLTATDLEDVMDLTSLNKIFNKTQTYYVSANKLYEDNIFETEVDFEYQVDGGNVVVDGTEFAISSGKVNITLKHLPLTTAITAFTSNLGNRLTLQELKTDYGVNLPSYIYNGNETKTINEIETIIDNVYVADILGYTIDAHNKVWNGETEVTGIMAIIAQKTVGGLGDIQSIIQDETIATLLDYTVNGDTVTKKDGTPVTGLLAKVAKCKVGEVNNVVNTITLSDVFSSTELSSGIFGLLDQSTVGEIKVVEVADKLKTAINGSSMGDLQDAGLIDGSYDLTLSIDTNADGTKDTPIEEISLNNFVDIAITILTK